MKQANTTVQIMTWTTSILIGVLLATWLPGNLQPLQQSVQTVNQDLTHLQSLVSHACTSQTFSATYNPLTEDGVLTVNQTTLCINTTTYSCRTLACPSKNNTVALNKITDLSVRANDTVTIT